jgi:hypothetical protein
MEAAVRARRMTVDLDAIRLGAGRDGAGKRLS